MVKKFSSPGVKQASRLVLALGVLTALVACGGGGGGSGFAEPPSGGVPMPPPAPAPAPVPTPPPPPPPPPAPSLNVTGPTSCGIPGGEKECSVVLALAQQNLTNPTYQIGSEAPQPLSPAQGSLTVTLKNVSTMVVTFKNGDGTTLRTVSLGASCNEGLPWNTGKQNCSWQYDQVTIMSFSGYPAIAGPDRLPVLAKNDTGYTVGGFPISQCLTSEAPQPDGVMLVKCAIAQLGGLRTTLGWIIPENRLVKWEKPVPPGLEWEQKQGEAPTLIGPQWHQCQRYCATAGTWMTPPFPDSVVWMYSWAKLKDGGYLFVGVSEALGQALHYRTPDGGVVLLKDYTGTQFPTGYSFRTIEWLLTISH